MNPTEYEKNVLITESNNFPVIKERTDDKMIRLLHAGLGLSSELSELADGYMNEEIDWVNIAEEIGDLTWYCAVATNALEFDAEEIAKHGNAVTISLVRTREGLKQVLLTGVYLVGEFNDLLKKSLFYGRELDLTALQKKLQQLSIVTSNLALVSGTTIEEVRQTNINKLKARYGEKFTEAAALNRDLETERKVLEEGKS